MANISASKSQNLSSNLGGSFTITAFFEETGIQDDSSVIEAKATFSRNSGNFEVTNAGTMKLFWFDDNLNTSGTELASVVISSSFTAPHYLTSTIVVPHKEDGTLSGYAKVTWTKDRNYDYIANSGNVQTDNTALTFIDQGLFRIGVSGAWKKATAYIGVGGVWKKTKAYIGVGGNWKKGI